MPPKKKAPRPRRATSTPSEDVAEQTREEAPTLMKTDDPRNYVLPDAWTDEQETSLFKSMIQCKPVGMHKHFRMIDIWEKMRSRGYNGYTQPHYAHTKIPGIWEKLGSLYNLETLDAREDAVGKQFYPFDLPDEPSGENDGYRDLKFARRLDSEGPSSPPLLPHQLSEIPVEVGKSVRRHSTVDDTDDPRSSPASNTGRRTGRGTRGSRGTRVSRLAEVSTMKGRQSQSSPDQGTENDQKDEDEEVDTMEIDEGDGKAAASKYNKASKAATGKGSARRSGRKR